MWFKCRLTTCFYYIASILFFPCKHVLTFFFGKVRDTLLILNDVHFKSIPIVDRPSSRRAAILLHVSDSPNMYLQS